MDRPQEYLEVIGVVTGDPVCFPHESGGTSFWSFPVRLEGVNRSGVWQRAEGRAVVKYRTDAGDAIHYGERRSFLGVVSFIPPSERRNLAVAYEVEAGTGGTCLLEEGQGSVILGSCYALRRRCARTLTLGIEGQTATVSLLKALLLGYREDLSDDLHRMFAASGTLHIFAISGLHVGIVAVFITVLLRSAGLSRNRWVFALAPLLIIYVCCTGLKASAVRACVMALVFSSALAFRRKPDGLTALALAAIGILIFSPAQLFNAGFIMSFTIVLGLMLLCPFLMNPVISLLKRDEYSVGSDNRWQAIGRWGIFWFTGLLVTSVAAWIAATPLTAHFFHIVSPVALLGNLLTIPMTTLIVLTGFLSLLLGAISPFSAEVANAANCLFTSILLGGVRRLTDLPMSHFYVQSPHWSVVVCYYAFGGLFLISRKLKWLAIVSLVAVIAGGTASALVLRGDVTADFFGGGRSVTMLIDGGSAGHVLVNTGPRFLGRRLLKRLRKQGVNHLSTIVLTQVDAEHAGAAVRIMRQIPTHEIWVPRHIGKSPVAPKIFAEAQRLGVGTVFLSAGEQYEWGDALFCEVLHPGEGSKGGRIADRALILRVSCGGTSVLFAGGSSKRGQLESLAGPVEVASSVLVVDDADAHASWSREWLQEVSPDFAVVSTSEGRVIRKKGQAIRDALSQELIPVVCADEDADLRLNMRLGR